MDTADVFALTGRLRRAQPRNPDVLAACDELERRTRLEGMTSAVRRVATVLTRAESTADAEAITEGLKKAARKGQRDEDAMKRGLGTTKIGKRRAKRPRK